MNDPKLTINTDSWHYRYFIFIRHFWGMQDDPYRTSLCPYCQTIFWFSLFAAVLLPLFVFGWTLLKILRLTYKGCDLLGLNFLIDLIDMTPVGAVLEKSDSKLKESPALTAILIIFVTACTLGFIGSLLVLFVWALGYSIFHISEFPAAVWDFILRTGWVFFYAFSLVGWLLNKIGLGISYGFHWFFSNEPLLHGIAYWSVAILLFGCVSVVVMGLSSLLFQSRLGQWLWNTVLNRLNGYGEARSRAKARRDAARLARLDAERAAEIPAPDRGPCWVTRMWRKIWGEKKIVDGVEQRVLGPLAICWTFMVAVKKNMCPLVEFTKPDAEKK